MSEPASQSPLAGIRVLDVSKNFAGPYAGLILSDLGADVIKVEEPTRGDESRHFPPFMRGGMSASFASLNRGKRSVAIDLKAGGQTREEVEALIASSDVFIENLRPGALDGLGLGFDRIAELNPNIIHCSVSAFGDQGEHAGEPGYDPMIQAFSGLMDITGDPDGPPSRVGTGVIDMGTGMWVAMRVITALYERKNGRVGPIHIQVTLVETAASFLIHHLTAARNAGADPSRLGSAMHNMAPYEAVQTKDEPIMVAAGSQRLYEKLCHVIEAPHLLTDARFVTNDDRLAHRRELIAEIEKSTAFFTAADLVKALKNVGIPTSVIRRVSEFAQDPQLDAQDYWRGAQGEDWRLPSLPLGIPGSGTFDRVPTLGEDTDDVLRSLAPNGSSSPMHVKGAAEA